MTPINAWSEENVSLTALRQRQYQPANGIDIPDRVNISTLTQTSGALRLSFFTPTRTLTVSNFNAVSATGATDTGGTTVRKLGLFTVNATYTQVTCVARSANDTSLATVNNTIYTKTFTSESGYSSSYTLLAGTTYAVGWLFYNTGGTFAGPTMVGWTTNTTAGGANQNLLPMLVGAVFSQTDITNSAVNITDLSTANGIYMRLT
jgi:hypothetical protein